MNSRAGRLLVVIFVLGLSPAMAQEQEAVTPTSVTVHRRYAGELSEDGWCEAQATGGHFRVLMPGKFHDASGIKLSDKGIGKTLVIDSAYPAPITCRVTESQAPKRADLPAFRWVDEIVRDEVIEASEQIQKSRGGMLYGIRKFDFHGFPAVDFRLVEDGQVTLTRAIIQPGSSFVLTARCSVADHAKVSAKAKKFFDSFQFDPPREAKYLTEEESKAQLLKWAIQMNQEKGILQNRDSTQRVPE